jgi:predicted hotdog family 3-hydroxylacyl-ACP dehydratase
VERTVIGGFAPRHRTRVPIPDGFPFFAGHFDGNPLLPGVAQLELVRRLLRARRGGELELTGLESLRLRRLVHPGDELEVTVGDARDNGSTPFEVSCEGLLSGHGRVVVRPLPPPPDPAGDLDDDGSSSGFPDPAELVPHRHPMLTLEAVLAWADDHLVARSVIPAESAFAEGGVVPPLFALEIAAQAAAAFEALLRRTSGGPETPRVGYLVGARDVLLCRPLRVSEPLRTVVRLDACVPPLTTYRFRVEAGPELCAEGSISTYIAG